MKSRTFWVVSVVVVSLFCLAGWGLFWGSLLFSPDWTDTRGDIAVVEVKGTIFESQPVNEKLEKYRKSTSIKAVVLRVDSPGGAVAPSQEIYTEVKKLAEKKKVVVSMGTVAASGGYYISAPATKILANPGTITGSIGVLMEHVEIEKLLEWAKVSAEIMKAGKMKDAGSALREMTPEEREYLQNLLKTMHHQFQKAVADGRNLPLEEVEKIGDGRVFTGEEALNLKLVDQIGDLQDAIEVAKNLAGIKGEPKIVWPEKQKSFLQELLFGDGSDRLFQSVVSHVVGSKAFYLMEM